MLFGGPGFASGFLMGFGTGFVSRELVQAGAAIAKPLARAFIKAGLTAYEKGRESMAQVGETFDDLLAEVRVGMSQPVADEHEAAAGAAADLQESKTADEHKKKKGSHK